MSTMPALNLPSFRLAFETQIASLPHEIQAVHRNTFNAITDIYEGFSALNSKVNALKTSTGTGATTTTTVNNNISTETIIQIASTIIGNVNNQVGITSYSTQQSDYGSLILFNDASAIAVSLSVLGSNPGIQLPWFTAIYNAGSSTLTVTPASGTINGGATITIGGGDFGIIYFDGTNFWALIPTSGGGGGVTQIVAGTNVTISPVGGTGVVTVNSTGGGSTPVKQTVAIGTGTLAPQTNLTLIPPPVAGQSATSVIVGTIVCPSSAQPFFIQVTPYWSTTSSAMGFEISNCSTTIPWTYTGVDLLVAVWV